jgi:hypothetical protein
MEDFPAVFYFLSFQKAELAQKEDLFFTDPAGHFSNYQ